MDCTHATFYKVYDAINDIVYCPFCTDWTRDRKTRFLSSIYFLGQYYLIGCKRRHIFCIPRMDNLIEKPAIVHDRFNKTLPVRHIFKFA